MTAAATNADAQAPAAAAAPAPRTRTPLKRAAKRSPMSSLMLGLTMARRGILPTAAIVICLLTALVSAILAFVIGLRGPMSPGHDVPIVAASALAWGGGFLLAFSASAHALRKDRADGIRALFVARTTSLRGYLFGRIGGLALLVAFLVAGGALLTGLCATVAALASGGAGMVLQTTFASVVYGIGFSVVVAPVAFAALGARSRLGGYIFLIGIVTMPELLVVVAGNALPPALAEVLSIPSALVALRGSLLPGSVDLLRTLRAITALAVFVGLASALVRRDASLVAHPEPE